uniref:GB1/RHD3-type G domain-containing protein n=1 Tax=Chelonoidis abingdonii TaxID=106734 RepID=A0A8C0IS10_CHEAB
MAMEGPVCLVGNGADGQLEVMEEALGILRGVAQPVVVAAIVGLYRTGKSYLMNSLAGKQRGFSLGSTVQSHTKGIWMWCLPHPRRAGHTLVLLDTEGLGDVEKGDTKNDVWIFALAVLLSSTLVYNSKGTIDQYAMEQLHFVSELTEHIKVKAQRGDDAEEDTEFVRFFPSFVWAVRDFTLELRIEGQLVTEDQYLEHALLLLLGSPGNSKKVMDYNLPRQCIRSFFPTRKCFVFVQPASRQEMGQLDSLPTSALDPQFLEQIRRFCDYIFQCSNVKTVKGGVLVNRQRFGALVRSYVDTIRSGQVPCLDNAVTVMAAIENEAALREALAHYAAGMAGLRLLAELGELSAAHGTCEEDALRLFMQRSFKDEEQGFQKRLVVGGGVLVQAQQQGENCWDGSALWRAPWAPVVGQGPFVPGAVRIPDRNLVPLMNNPALGHLWAQAEEALEQFLASKKAEAEAVLKADNLLTEAEKHVAEEKQKAELLEQQRKAAEEKQLQMEQLMKDQERSHQENVKQLEAKVAEELASARQEAERALQSKLKEQEAMLQKGFAEKARNKRDEPDCIVLAQGSATFQQCCAESSFIHSNLRFHEPVIHFNIRRKSLSISL